MMLDREVLREVLRTRIQSLETQRARVIWQRGPLPLDERPEDRAEMRRLDVELHATIREWAALVHEEPIPFP